MMKANINQTIQEYIAITIGLVLAAGAITSFLMPYELTTGGLTGIALILFYSPLHIPIDMTYFFVNLALLGVALKILGIKFLAKTIYGWLMLTALLKIFPAIFPVYTLEDVGTEMNGILVTQDMVGQMVRLMGENQEFMASVAGAGIIGFGIGLVFSMGGSTGGTDIVAWIINKYKNVSLGRLMMYCDILIISSCYFVFHDWKKVLFGFVILFIMSLMIDNTINKSKKSVQLIIFTKKPEEVADGINTRIKRGVTLLHGMSWYTKKETEVVIVMARKAQCMQIYNVLRDIDMDAFVTQCDVSGVYGEGFDHIRFDS